MLISKTVKDPLGRVTLLARHGQVRTQPPVDDLAAIVDLAATVGILLALRGPG